MKNITLVLLSVLILLSSFMLFDNKEVQCAWYECQEPENIDSTLFNVKKGETYFVFNKKLQPKGLKEKGFYSLPDNPGFYFTAYLINTSDSTFNADKQDGSLIMIQEALNAKNEWKPIEYWVPSRCGNSYFSPLHLDSGKYVMIPIKKYEGSFKTKFRLKMKKGKTIFYSDTFDGSVEKSQFNKIDGNVQGVLFNGRPSYLDPRK